MQLLCHKPLLSQTLVMGGKMTGATTHLELRLAHNLPRGRSLNFITMMIKQKTKWGRLEEFVRKYLHLVLLLQGMLVKLKLLRVDVVKLLALL